MSDSPRKPPHLTVKTREAQLKHRLQSLFPTSPNATGPPATNDADPLAQSPRSAAVSPKFLKVRILTWNMHDSVPKGDLEELFGKVPQYTPPASKSSPPSFPQFTADAEHPYHLILVAGQECPSTSGIPMGIGAGFKLKEDREKDEKARQSKHSHGHESIKSKKSTDEYIAESQSHHPAGWTSMVEDWLCYGGSAARATSPTTSDISVPKPLSPRTASKDPKKGPYQLLCKERLLGIYLAMYVHRDLKPLVENTSKAFVPAGLLGGRWGNKGGVGISAKIDGSTFLFMNCHLAAQVDKANLQDRLNNYNKIKAELSVDDFLSNDDPRVMAEGQTTLASDDILLNLGLDLSDKFDYTFVFGDLNFRLDITRLHADWIISRQDYAQALAFDQLRNLMSLGRAFVGFSEAEIQFPPTFKYDVLRTLKGSRLRGSRLNRFRNPNDKTPRLTEVEEKELAEMDDADNEKDSDGEGDEEGEGGEGASLASSAWTSMHSRAVTEHELDEDYFGSTPNMVRSTSVPGSKASLAMAAHKAKTKWLSLLSPTVPPSPTKWLKKPFMEQQNVATKNQRQKAHRSVEDLKLVIRDRDGDSEISPDGTSDPIPPRPRLNSSKSNIPSDEDDNSQNRGVYDSSHKKRVPSWCDRILFKSTVQPDPEPEPEESDNPVRTRTKMGQFLANAFRPLSARSRRESFSSLSSYVHSVTSSMSVPSNATPKGDTTPSSPLHSPDLLEEVAPFSRFVYGDARALTGDSPNGIVSPPEHSAPQSSAPQPFANEVEARVKRSFSSSSRNRSKPGTPDRVPRRASTSMQASIPLSDGSPFTGFRDHHISTPSKWRFFPFVHHSTPSNSSDIPTAATTPAPKPPRKGDVVCLSYDTLDDIGMRRLEGRSDHRPVLGEYAVYL